MKKYIRPTLEIEILETKDIMTPSEDTKVWLGGDSVTVITNPNNDNEVDIVGDINGIL